MYVYYESTRTHLYFAIFANFDPFAKLLKPAAVLQKVTCSWMILNANKWSIIMYSCILQFSKPVEISDCPLSNFLLCGVRVAPSFQPMILIRIIPVSCFRACAPYAHLRKSCWRLGTPLSFCMDTWMIILEYAWALELQFVSLLVIWDVLGIKFWEKAEQTSLVHMRGMGTHFEAMWRTDKTAWSARDWPRSNWMALQLCLDQAEGLLRVACAVQGELQRFFHVKEIRTSFRDRTISQTLSSLETRNKRDCRVSQSQWDLAKLADFPKLEDELGQFDML